MKNIVLFDLGNTLLQYYEMRDFPDVLRRAVQDASVAAGSAPEWERVNAENFEAPDNCVRPFEDRLRRIFSVSEEAWTPDRAISACRAFLGPIFALAFVYPDVMPTLRRLKERNVRTAIISNTPWGSPAALWQEELDRLGLAPLVDLTVFCRDCGWRKPARQIFDHTLKELSAVPEQCVFVGDDPRWDIAGPQAVGIAGLLINRQTQTLDDLLGGMAPL